MLGLRWAVMREALEHALRMASGRQTKSKLTPLPRLEREMARDKALGRPRTAEENQRILEELKRAIVTREMEQDG